jgi:hypothetical protein
MEKVLQRYHATHSPSPAAANMRHHVAVARCRRMPLAACRSCCPMARHYARRCRQTSPDVAAMSRRRAASAHMPAYHSGKPATPCALMRAARARASAPDAAPRCLRDAFSPVRVAQDLSATYTLLRYFHRSLPQIEYFTILPPSFSFITPYACCRGGAASVCRRMIRRHAGFSFFFTISSLDYLLRFIDFHFHFIFAASHSMPFSP